MKYFIKNFTNNYYFDGKNEKLYSNNGKEIKLEENSIGRFYRLKDNDGKNQKVYLKDLELVDTMEEENEIIAEKASPVFPPAQMTAEQKNGLWGAFDPYEHYKDRDEMEAYASSDYSCNKWNQTKGYQLRGWEVITIDDGVVFDMFRYVFLPKYQRVIDAKTMNLVDHVIDEKTNRIYFIIDGQQYDIGLCYDLKNMYKSDNGPERVFNNERIECLLKGEEYEEPSDPYWF